MRILKYSMPYFLMLPAIVIGAFAMILYGIDKGIWLQNILFWVISTILGCTFVVSKNEDSFSDNNFVLDVITAVLIIILLTATLPFNGSDEVSRWIVLGNIRLNAANAFLPLLIISLWNLSRKQRTFIVLTLTGITLVILLLQPDASQVSAFASANIILMWEQISSKRGKLFYLTAITATFALSWIFLDNLAPVPYVERILFLLLDINIFWFVLGIISLVLLLIPFFVLNKSKLSVSLGVYFTVTILTTFFGNFPMPIMGYGISSVIGYSIAITLLMKYVRIV